LYLLQSEEGTDGVDKWHRQSTLRIRALSHTDELAATWSDFLLLVRRLLLGWLFFASGYGKLGNIGVTAGYFTSLGTSPPDFWPGSLALPNSFLEWP
jgi:hypothetical protein